MGFSISANQFLEAAAYRRTCYALTNTSKVSDDRIVEIVKKVLLFAPSSYNMQSARLTVVFGKKHEAMWDAVIEAAAPIFQKAGIWGAMKPILEASRNCYGSVRYCPILLTSCVSWRRRIYDIACEEPCSRRS